MSIELTKNYNSKENEDKIYQQWLDSGFFNPDNLPERHQKPFTIILPPPNVTGELHAGHSMMLAIEDAIIRYKRLQGFKTLWLPGFDHAAIATQTRVEKKILKEENKTRHDLGREKFLEKVDEFVEKSRKTILKQSQKMGSSLDWSRTAYTLDDKRNFAVRTIFKKMYDDDLIYRGNRIVNWCPRCSSTLADDEVEHKQSQTKFYTFKYDEDFPFAISTVRPETKLGDTAVAVNPKDERYKKYIGKTFDVNFCGKDLKIKIITDHKVDMEFGAGALGVTPAHSAIDWQMAEKNNLEKIKIIGEDGTMTDAAEKFAGMKIKECRSKIVEYLHENNLMEKEEDYTNNLSICYRCGCPIEPLPSLQWFIDVNKKIPGKNKSLKELSLEVVRSKEIEIIPERFEKNYFHWMENLRDWCISRQIWFGHQIPVWYKKNEIYVGVEAPNGNDWIQDEDTLDTWFSAGIWTFSTLGYPEQTSDLKTFHPTQILETGYDILFFWVARMILMTTYTLDEIPFETVYLHGLVRDKNGKKMSKSKPETCINPLDVIKKYGTDAVRLSLISGNTPGNDLNLSEEKIAGFKKFANKLWNISRFILMNSDSNVILSEAATKSEDLRVKISEPKTLSDKWILQEFNLLIENTTDNLDKFRLSQAIENLYEFTWNKFADWYLEIAKIEKNKNEILIYILKNLLILWHPFCPFVTETIWQEIFQGKSMLIVEQWPKLDEQLLTFLSSKDTKSDFEVLQNTVSTIRNWRAENKIPPKNILECKIESEKYQELIDDHKNLIEELRTRVEIVDELGGEKIKLKDIKITIQK